MSVDRPPPHITRIFEAFRSLFRRCCRVEQHALDDALFRNCRHVDQDALDDFLNEESRRQYFMHSSEKEILLFLCGAAKCCKQPRKRLDYVNLLLTHQLDKWLIQSMRVEMDPASAMLRLSALISLEQLACTVDEDAQKPAMGWLHRFVELMEHGTDLYGPQATHCNYYKTYRHMGCALFRAINSEEFGFIHPLFREDPLCCARGVGCGSFLDEEYWVRRVVEKENY
ncbi:hypothetical protein MYCTH_89991 [Thermothelomyces thermophilus ATCC 42464]|uniref:Uncharacterized protein n=1 Tax=Thermothelomyces thermophilus (strain ATCC 42464 / BCRC 31852 / DSM 1799) TaxID=573729 RepID=G2QM07_THET4|nr:uncharacterized protein MYCTH_89991 [Thermothelomyces thermophilus ATCC 42464]AEO60987.1 hypothetical protein MYCTH_89991 [Thermothelomyces thermophilus ATCC 42464]